MNISNYKNLEINRSLNKIKDFTRCPHCGITASGNSSVKNIFGFRNMGNGITRVQSWCKDCRSKTVGIVGWL